MITPLSILLGIILLTIVLDLILIFDTKITRAQGGKVLAFSGILILPALIGLFSLQTHIEDSKKTEFCLSCHVMEDYGKSLHVDDNEYIPAIHFQNNRIPQDQACYTCHTEYTMYGDFSSKIRGLEHIYYQYIGTIPDTIKLREPYNNRECLHCHDGARGFEESSAHRETPLMMDSLKSNGVSCLTSGCHDVAHDIRNLAEAEFWEPGKLKAVPAHESTAPSDSTATDEEE